MKLKTLIEKLTEFEKALGSGTDVYVLDNEAIVKYDINVGMGFDEKQKKFRCLLIGDQDVFDMVTSKDEPTQ